jgi:hypothetical protein
MRCRTLALALLLLPLLGCPPNRGNLPDASDTGGSYSQAYFVWRYMPTYDVTVVYMILPREEEAFGCELAYGVNWYDDDGDFAELYWLKGDSTEWEGEYPNFYSPDCPTSYDYDYASSHCVTGQGGVDPEGAPFDNDAVSMEIDAWDDDRILGSVTYEASGLSERFRGVDCGEQDYYYYYEGRSERPRPEQAGQQVDRPAWKLRFR